MTMPPWSMLWAPFRCSDVQPSGEITEDWDGSSDRDVVPASVTTEK